MGLSLSWMIGTSLRLSMPYRRLLGLKGMPFLLNTSVTCSISESYPSFKASVSQRVFLFDFSLTLNLVTDREFSILICLALSMVSVGYRFCKMFYLFSFSKITSSIGIGIYRLGFRTGREADFTTSIASFLPTVPLIWVCLKALLISICLFCCALMIFLFLSQSLIILISY